MISLLGKLQTQKHDVKFFNRVPVHLTVTDLRKHSLVTLPNWGLGIGFSYSQHSKICQLLIRVAGFYSLAHRYEYFEFFLRQWILHVKLVNGSRALSDRLHYFMHIEGLTLTCLGNALVGAFKQQEKSFLEGLAFCLQRVQGLPCYKNWPFESKKLLRLVDEKIVAFESFYTLL